MINSVKNWKANGYFLRQPPVTLVFYDPAGDGNDRDAIVLVNREEHQRGETWDPDFAVERMYRIVQAYEVPIGLEFPDKLALLLRIHMEMNKKQRSGMIHTHIFGVETNGVGYGMASSMRVKCGQHVIPYVTVGTSKKETPVEGKAIAMPRLAGLDNLRILAETHHLKMAKGAPGSKEMTSQMNSFVWRRPGRPEAVQGARDDLVMALCGACWIGEKILGPTLRQTRFRAGSKMVN